MAETIKAFIEKLQADGVEAGQRAADQIQSEARQRAQSVIHEAQEQARKIIEEADRQIERNRAGAQMQLQLAARDTLIRLQETLSRAWTQFCDPRPWRRCTKWHTRRGNLVGA